MNKQSIEVKRLVSKDPSNWSVSEVALWLDLIDCKEHKISFIENSISGGELFDLTDEDLVTMGVSKLGQRKKIIAKIKAISSGFTLEPASSVKDSIEDSTSSSGTGWEETSLDSGEILVKCHFVGEVRLIRVPMDTSLRNLKRRIRKEFGVRMNVKWKDSEGDLIAIRKESHWKNAVRATKAGPIRLVLAKKTGTVINDRELAFLENLVDGIIVINEKGTVIFFNRAAEKMFGFLRTEVVDKNVKILMPVEYAMQHDDYIRRYIATGIGPVVGKGRKIIAQRKNGTTFPAYLSVAEVKSGGGLIFTGTIQDISIRNTDVVRSSKEDNSAYYAVLENILDACTVIDETGTIKFVNKQTTKMLGFSPMEVVGRNVRVLMPSPFQEEHDTYLRNYLTTGIAKVIGKGRDVVAQCKDGSLIPVNLSLTENKISETERIYTGILRKLEEERVSEKSVLQQEREVLDSLVVPAIIITETGIINAFNIGAQELFGYSLIEVVGKNIKQLMPSPERENHDSYLSEYRKTGKSRVIGIGRDVIGIHKSGTLLSLRLSVTEKVTDDGKKIFTGILQKI